MPEASQTRAGIQTYGGCWPHDLKKVKFQNEQNNETHTKAFYCLLSCCPLSAESVFVDISPITFPSQDYANDECSECYNDTAQEYIKLYMQTEYTTWCTSQGSG